MSYAIAPTFEANKIGVRRAYTLGRMGAAPDALALQMIQDGYDISVITTLTDLGATDAQLQFLYDNYGAGTQEFADAANQLQVQLSGRAGGTVSPGAQAPVPVIQTSFGLIDLSAKESWDFISGQFSSTQQSLNALAAKAPGDPEVRQMVTDFNGSVVQWAGYYQSVFGNAPSPLPMASIPTLSGLGVAPLVIGAAVIAGVAALLGTLYLLNQRIALKNQSLLAQAQVTQSQSQSSAVSQAAATINSLNNSANSKDAQANALPPSQATQAAALHASAAQDRQTAAQLQGQMLASTAPPQPSGALTSWFTQNWMGVAAVLVAVAVLPNLVKKL